MEFYLQVAVAAAGGLFGAGVAWAAIRYELQHLMYRINEHASNFKEIGDAMDFQAKALESSKLNIRELQVQIDDARSEKRRLSHSHKL